MNELKNAEASKQHRIEVEKANASEAAKKIDEKTIKMTAKAGQGGRLFGSVTAKEIAEELKSSTAWMWISGKSSWTGTSRRSAPTAARSSFTPASAPRCMWW